MWEKIWIAGLIVIAIGINLLIISFALKPDVPDLKPEGPAIYSENPQLEWFPRKDYDRLPVFLDNKSAKEGGMSIGQFYKDPLTGYVMVVH